MEKEGEKKYRISSKLTDQELIKLQFLLENKEIEDLKIFKFSLQDFDLETLKKLEDYNDLKVAYFVIQEEKSIPFFVKLIHGNKLENITLNLPRSNDCLLIFQALNNSKFIEHLFILQKFEKGLEEIQKFVNQNKNLKSLRIENSDSNWDLSPFLNEIQDNYSIQYLSLNPINVKQYEFSSFNKFKSLKTLILKVKHYKPYEYRYYTLDYNKKSLKNESIIETPLNFSKLFIKKFDFSISKLDNQSMIYLMKSLKEVAFFEELYLGFSISRAYFEDFSEWVLELKDILVNNQNLKTLDISLMSLIEKDFEILCEGFEKNESLTKLNILGNDLGKYAVQFGKILKSKVNLQSLKIGDIYFKFKEFMKEFQSQENIKIFYLTKCKLDVESDELISNFILNNRSLNSFSLIANSIESIKNTFKALNSHKKIKEITIDLESFIPGKYIVDLVKNNSKFESISISNVDFTDNELKECFEALSKDSILTSFKLPFPLLYRSSLPFKMDIIEEYLFYNYSLKDIKIGENKSIYCQRNKEFITNYYKIKIINHFDMNFSFK